MPTLQGKCITPGKFIDEVQRILINTELPACPERAVQGDSPSHPKASGILRSSRFAILVMAATQGRCSQRLPLQNPNGLNEPFEVVSVHATRHLQPVFLNKKTGNTPRK
jgi:hypothetical protein